jgi:hypothetical protein
MPTHSSSSERSTRMAITGTQLTSLRCACYEWAGNDPGSVAGRFWGGLWGRLWPGLWCGNWKGKNADKDACLIEVDVKEACGRYRKSAEYGDVNAQQRLVEDSGSVSPLAIALRHL